MIIDPHVHCRDGAESYKETIGHVFRLCDGQGVDMIFDMPNTTPPVVGPRQFDARLKLVPKTARDRYRLFVGATAEDAQLREAAGLAAGRKEAAGIKLYACRSVGPLAVPEPDGQKRVYEILAACGYKGVLAVHCEKESMFTGVFDPASPMSHGASRPPAAETASVRDQVGFAIQSGFQGILHVCHVSLAESASIVKSGAAMGLRATCGVTPHHLLWSEEKMSGDCGLVYKVNPPLRPPAENAALRDALMRGLIDWIESDHAPHPLSEKLHPPYLSGYPSLCLFKTLAGETLPEWGLDADRIAALTGGNITKAFGEGKTV